MTCYMRHMTSLFDTLGLEYDKPNRRRVDGALREILGSRPDDHCPQVWAAIQALPEHERDALPSEVAQRLAM
jgi:hypothetical protein